MYSCLPQKGLDHRWDGNTNVAVKGLCQRQCRADADDWHSCGRKVRRFCRKVEKQNRENDPFITVQWKAVMYEAVLEGCHSKWANKGSWKLKQDYEHLLASRTKRHTVVPVLHANVHKNRSAFQLLIVSQRKCQWMEGLCSYTICTERGVLWLLYKQTNSAVIEQVQEADCSEQKEINSTHWESWRSPVLLREIRWMKQIRQKRSEQDCNESGSGKRVN